MKSIHIILILVGFLLLGASCGRASVSTNTNVSQNINTAKIVAPLPTGYERIQLRTTPINLEDARFAKQSTSAGLILKRAWYDAAKQFLVVGTSKTFSQYCGVTPDAWAQFTPAVSFDSVVAAFEKGKFLCTKDTVPLYAEDAVAAGFTAPADGSQVIQLRKVFTDDECVINEYCETETEEGKAEDVYIYQVEGDHLLGIGEDDIAVEVYQQ